MSATRRPVTLAVLLAVAVVAVQALLVPLFAGPATHLAPRDLPLAVAGPQPAAGQLAARLEAARPGAFDIRIVPDGDAALRDHEVYGSIVLGAAGPEMHIASAASPAVATLLTQAAAELAPGRPVTDVVPTMAADPRGAGFGAAFLPLAMTSLVAGLLAFLLVRRRAARLLAVTLFATGAGLAGAAVQQFWLDVLPGNYFAVAGGLALFALAVAATVCGLGAVADRPGAALAAVTIFLIGNPLSGVTAAPELLPQPWGAVGQYLPIGAGSSVVRAVAYFDGAGAGLAFAVLGAYALGGLLLVAAGRRGTDLASRGLAGKTPEATPQPVPAA
ncbi:hypothetical protein [Symbioplanes lichenis]|uniref:hypothetical protein n=1 Tax=Symbioplanes lichenis TaxID=1629072 RepID=UPI0027384DCF|nr:hypothetical protein [Actinoplanes lichenis]